MNFINDNQIALLLTCFALGISGTVFLFRFRVSSRAWKVADLMWVCLGGAGTVAALVAGIYRADTSRLDRQIDLAYAASSAFDRDAGVFRLAHCEVAHPSATFASAIAELCDKADFLSASVAGNSRLPLFLSVAERAAPLNGLHLLFGPSAREDEQAMSDAMRFDAAEFLAFAAQDDRTRAAVELLRAAPSVSGIAAEYTILAQSYEDLVGEVMHLQDEWRYLQSRSGILTVQVLALCLIAFAAPFRIGKSIHDLA